MVFLEEQKVASRFSQVKIPKIKTTGDILKKISRLFVKLKKNKVFPKRFRSHC